MLTACQYDVRCPVCRGKDDSILQKKEEEDTLSSAFQSARSIMQITLRARDTVRSIRRVLSSDGTTPPPEEEGEAGDLSSSQQESAEEGGDGEVRMVFEWDGEEENLLPTEGLESDLDSEESEDSEEEVTPREWDGVPYMDRYRTKMEEEMGLCDQIVEEMEAVSNREAKRFWRENPQILDLKRKLRNTRRRYHHARRRGEEEWERRGRRQEGEDRGSV